MSIIKNWMNVYHTELETLVCDSETLLDVGCGENSPIKYFNKRLNYSVGVDGFQKSIDLCKKEKIHDEYHCINILNIKDNFNNNSFDCVIALDVIEHLEKDLGFELINQMESISSNKVIIFTPNGFLPQAEHSDNIYQKHLSGWTVDEMHDLGYSVIGINGWKPLLGEMSIPNFKPHKLWTFISRLTQPFVRNNPKHAFQILCIKYLNDSLC